MYEQLNLFIIQGQRINSYNLLFEFRFRYLEILNGVAMTGKFDVAHFEWCRTLGEGSFATVLLARLKTNFGGNAAGQEFAIKKVISNLAYFKNFNPVKRLAKIL